MKAKKLRGKLFSVIFVLCIFFNDRVNAQPGQSFTYNFYRGYLIGEGYTIVEDKYCKLAQGETCSLTRRFFTNNTYKIIAFSDDTDVTDVDLYAYNSNGTLYDKDDEDDRSASLIIRPYLFARDLKITWKSFASRTPRYSSTVYLIIGYK